MAILCHIVLQAVLHSSKNCIKIEMLFVLKEFKAKTNSKDVGLAIFVYVKISLVNREYM